MGNYLHGNWRHNAEKSDYRKYFRQMDRIYFGIYGNGWHEYNPDAFAKYELTTKLGVKNTIKDMVKDHKRLIRKIESQGIKLDYCAVPELSPLNQLIHLHGIMRNNSYNGKDHIIEKEKLSEYWEQIHGAKITWISKPKSFKGVVEYMVKHTVKDYPVSSKLGFRALTSKHWLPENCELVKGIIAKSAIYRIKNSTDVDLKAEWEKANNNMLLWVKGKNTKAMRLMDNEPFYILHNQVMLLTGEVYSLIDYGIHSGIIKNL